MNFNEGHVTSIISKKNEQLEYEMLRTAEQIIDCIAKEQNDIVRSQEKIKELREKLLKLSVTSLDPKTILGQE